MLFWNYVNCQKMFEQSDIAEIWFCFETPEMCVRLEILFLFCNCMIVRSVDFLWKSKKWNLINVGCVKLVHILEIATFSIVFWHMSNVWFFWNIYILCDLWCFSAFFLRFWKFKPSPPPVPLPFQGGCQNLEFSIFEKEMFWNLRILWHLGQFDLKQNWKFNLCCSEIVQIDNIC